MMEGGRRCRQEWRKGDREWWAVREGEWSCLLMKYKTTTTRLSLSSLINLHHVVATSHGPACSLVIHGSVAMGAQWSFFVDAGHCSPVVMAIVWLSSLLAGRRCLCGADCCSSVVGCSTSFLGLLSWFRVTGAVCGGKGWVTWHGGNVVTWCFHCH